MCGVIEPGLQRTCPLWISSRSTPLNRIPTLSPASPESKSFLNISTPVQTDFLVAVTPTISTSSPVLITPDSILPVATVPLPEIEKTSSTGIRKGLSISLVGWGINSSTAFINSIIEFFPISSSLPSTAANADPLTIGVLSPGYLYEVKSSLISSSTSSIISLSSTWSTLFK